MMKLKARVGELEAENRMLKMRLNDLEYKIKYIEECGMRNYLNKHLKDHIGVYATSVMVERDANMIIENFRLNMKDYNENVFNHAKEETLKNIR